MNSWWNTIKLTEWGMFFSSVIDYCFCQSTESFHVRFSHKQTNCSQFLFPSFIYNMFLYILQGEAGVSCSHCLTYIWIIVIFHIFSDFFLTKLLIFNENKLWFITLHVIKQCCSCNSDIFLFQNHILSDYQWRSVQH